MFPVLDGLTGTATAFDEPIQAFGRLASRGTSILHKISVMVLAMGEVQCEAVCGLLLFMTILQRSPFARDWLRRGAMPGFLMDRGRGMRQAAPRGQIGS